MTIEPLHALIGTCDLTDRSAGADEDDIFGTMTRTLILDGTVLQMTGTMRAGDLETDSQSSSTIAHSTMPSASTALPQHHEDQGCNANRHWRKRHRRTDA